MKIQEAMAAIMSKVGVVGKNGRNVKQEFNFRGVDSVVNALSPLLQEQGVIVVPTVLESTHQTVEIGANRTSMALVQVKVLYTFIGPEGDHIEATVIAESMDSGDKATAKAMSVAFRTVLIQVFALATGETDPDAENFERSSGSDQRSHRQSPAATTAMEPEIDPWTGQPVTPNENVRQMPAAPPPKRNCEHGAMRYWESRDKERKRFYCPLPDNDPRRCKFVAV